LPLRNEVTLSPSKRALLLDLEAIKATSPLVVAAACQVSQTRFEGDTLEFNAEGVADTEAVVRILAPGAPVGVVVAGKTLPPEDWVASGGTLQLRFQNSVQAVPVEVHFAP